MLKKRLYGEKSSHGQFKPAGSLSQATPNGPITFRAPWMSWGRPMKDIPLPKPLDWRPEKAKAHIHKCIEKTLQNQSPREQAICNQQVGRPDGDWSITATDGHRALMVPKGDQEPERFPLPEHSVVVCDLSLPLARIRAACSSAVNVEFRVGDTLELYAAFPGEAEAWEVIEDTPGSEPVNISFQLAYLLDVARLPLVFHYSAPNEYAVFRPLCDSWRYVIMPCLSMRRQK